MTLPQRIQPNPKMRRRSVAQAGYGLVMLLLFVASTVLIGASMSLLMGPSSSLGGVSQDNLSARSIAERGMETVLADIQTQVSAGNTVDTSYVYPVTNVTMPQDPTALGGATVTVGSFSGAITYARTNTYLVKITATVNSATTTLSRLVQMNRMAPVLDNITAPNVAFGLRKLSSAYGGSAIRVRRSSDDTEQDIGFDANGGLDMDSLRSFLSVSTLPMDSVSGSKAAAFGLRRLRNGYTGGMAINVRRSSDSATQDIGFTSAGYLDVDSLLSFVGTGTGYVATWYDQSGNGTDATQATASKQPTIVVNGQLNMVNNRPAILYDGVDDVLTFNRTISDDFSIIVSYSVNAGVGASDTTWANHAGIVDAYAGANTNSFGISVDNSGNIYAGMGNPDTSVSIANPGYNDNRMHWLGISRTKNHTGSNVVSYFSLQGDNNSFALSTSNQNALTSASSIAIGQLQTATTASLNGYVGEVLVYSTSRTPSSLWTLRRNAAWYFNQSPDVVSTNYPLDIVNTNSAILPTAAYSLRKLRSAYAGSAINVRRSSDNATTNIGFDNLGNLDVQTLLTWTGSGNSAYITKWYDQSGNGRDASQATAGNQPILVNAGSLYSSHGRPYAYFPSGSYTLGLTQINGIGDYSAFFIQATSYSAVFTALAGTNRSLIAIWQGGGNGWFLANDGANIYTTTYANRETAWTADATSGAIIRSGSNYTSYNQGAHSGTTVGGGGGTTFNFNSVGGYQMGTMFEALFYSSTLGTTDRQTMEKSMLNYYAMPTPTAYVTKWYDQSGNGNDAVQTSPILQPTLTLPRYGVFNNRPTINFNGGQYLTVSAGMPTNADYSKVAVFSYYSTTVLNNIISAGTAGGHALYTGGGTNLVLYHNVNFANTASNTLLQNTHYAVAATYQESGKLGTLYLSNISKGTGTAASSNTNATLQIGAYQGMSFLKGTVSEAMVFGRILTAKERTLFYNDERAYYGTQ